MTILTVEEFLKSLEHQTKLTHFNDTSSFASTTASLIEFSGLCRLELKVTNALKKIFNQRDILLGHDGHIE